MTLPSLTGVRGVAALWVFAFHLQFLSSGLGLGILKSVPLLGDGWTGVDLFFVLSGFILMFVHEDNFRRLRWQPVLTFARQRFFRIYPLATAILLVLLLIVVIDPGFAAWFRKAHQPDDLTATTFFRTLALSTRWFPPFTGDWNQPTWSLSAELLGYCALPILALIAARVRNRLVLALLALACLGTPVLIAPLIGSRIDNDIFGFAIIRMICGFAGGVLLCRLHRETPDRFRRAQGALADLALIVLLASLLFLPSHHTASSVPLFGLLIFGLAAGRGIANELFANRVALFFGAISFPLYLAHLMPMFWVYYLIGQRHLTPPQAMEASILGIIALLLMCWLLHRFVEGPSQRLMRRPAPAAGSLRPDSRESSRTPTSPG